MIIIKSNKNVIMDLELLRMALYLINSIPSE